MKKLLVLTFLLFLFADEGNACSCAGTPMPCEAYWKASAVFLGTVTYMTTTTAKPGEDDLYSRVFRFTVDKAFRGVEAKEVEVLTGRVEVIVAMDFNLAVSILFTPTETTPTG